MQIRMSVETLLSDLAHRRASSGTADPEIANLAPAGLMSDEPTKGEQVKYEYSVEQHVTDRDLLQVLERKAEEGWRMVQIIVISNMEGTTGSYHVVWEREKP